MNKSACGFTLVELLVVISIIAVLSVIGITIFSSAQKSARDGQRISNIHNLMNALEQYNTANGRYPDACNSSTSLACCSSWGHGDNWITGLVPNYMVSLPHDPKEPPTPGGPDICYVVNSTHSAYGLKYRLENSTSGAGTLLRSQTENGTFVYVYEKDYNCKAPDCQDL